MKLRNFIYTSLTRIANLQDISFTPTLLDQSEWETGDYVLVKVTDPGSGQLKIELTNGRSTEVMKGDYLIGAFGVRHATLEATGDWQKIGPDGKVDVLTGAGLFGKLTSKSVYIPQTIGSQYKGHLCVSGKKLNMRQFFSHKESIIPFSSPVVLIIGTSMSAGKTTAAKVIIRRLKEMNLRVTGAKLTGAGRYKDILAMHDAGADHIFDFVDVGLPSSILDADEYRGKLDILLSKIQETKPDVAVFEVGASPLEPYNGQTAIDRVLVHTKCLVLCATDPYAVLGVMEGFQLKPHFVTGIATNTLAGEELIKKLCKVDAINIIDGDQIPVLDEILKKTLNIHH